MAGWRQRPTSIPSASHAATAPTACPAECQHGTCAVACYEERDCARFYTCTTGDGTAGDCVLIGVSGQLYCDPDDDPYPCKCLDAVEGTQQCKPDGSELDQCICN
jgi:hypothetical protein